MKSDPSNKVLGIVMVLVTIVITGALFALGIKIISSATRKDVSVSGSSRQDKTTIAETEEGQTSEANPGDGNDQKTSASRSGRNTDGVQNNINSDVNASAAPGKNSGSDADISEEEKLLYGTETLKKVNLFDYYTDSITGLSDTMYSEEEITKVLKEKGAKFTGMPGMPLEEYRQAMERQWTDCTEYGRKVISAGFSLTKAYHYDEIVDVLKILSRYEGVYLYDIGETTEGRTMYALEIDIPDPETGIPNPDKKTIVLTGTTHARETAGTTIIVKELCELLENDTAENRELLQNIRFAAVACVNPDGREGVCFDTKNFTYSNGVLWKATSNGTDLNRNFPGLNFSQIGNGNKQTKNISNSPTKIYYPGPYGGSANETKTLMKFLYHYIVREKAAALIDYHQQGAIGYAGKSWDTKQHQKNCRELADSIFKMMNKGNSRKYSFFKEDDDYGLNGTGSTLTDYACAIAYGAKFSPAYGFCVYTDGKNEYPLCEIPRMDDCKIKFDIPNDSFRTMTFEIGYGQPYLGYSESTRKLIAKEYSDYHFDKVLYEFYKILSK